MTLSGFLKSAAVFCCTFFAVFLHAQTIDDFSDGDLTSNPAWQGDTANFQVNAVFQLQLNAPEEGTSALFLPVGIPDSAVWELYFHLDFDPSSSNRLKVYLHSNSSSLGSGNGYFIQIGDDGTADAIKFYRQDGGNNTLLATSTSAAVAVSPTVRLKMTKENGDTWKLAADYAGGFNYSPEFEVTDATYSADNNGYFGLLCTYTATRKDKFYFDDLSIPSPIPDTEPPVLISATAVSASEVDVFFNESLEEVSATEPANFNINNGIGNPAAVFSDASDKTLLHLSLATPLVSLTSYTLTTSNISDLNNNISLAQSATFSYIKTATAVEYDILINEIMADPTPAVTLPQVEFIELFNRSGKVIDLSGFTFSSGGTPQVFPFFQMLPGSYVIVCDDSRVDSLSDYGEVVVLSSFPALTNEADDLTLRNAAGQIIHHVSYSSAWYKDAQKADGGWTLELINPLAPCKDEANWRASANLLGGTPGQPNSVLSAQPDETRPQLTSVYAAPETPDEVLLIFSKGLDEVTAVDPSNYQLSPFVPVGSATLSSPSGNSVLLKLAAPLQKSTMYEVYALNSITDCVGNPMMDSSFLLVALPEQSDPQDLVINEILFNPETGGVDFVEIFNRSDKIFNLGDLVIANIKTGIDTVVSKVKNDRLIFPQEYAVFTESPGDIINRYIVKNENALILNDLPAFNDDEGNVTIYRADSTGIIVIDAFDYSENFHFTLLEDINGVSLERLDPARPAQDRFNWHSAAAFAGFATPTYLNSQFFENQSVEDNFFTIPEPTFSPDADGYKDFLTIFYKLDKPGYVVKVKIFDAEGRPIKSLANNELLATEGFLRWDGDTDEKSKARIGIYVIWIELFNPDGTVRRVKKAAVVAGRL